jgi:uncharacterized membrane protein
MVLSACGILAVVGLTLVVLFVIWLIKRGIKRMEDEPPYASPEGAEWNDIGKTLGHHKP